MHGGSNCYVGRRAWLAHLPWLLIARAPGAKRPWGCHSKPAQAAPSTLGHGCWRGGPISPMSQLGPKLIGSNPCFAHISQTTGSLGLVPEPSCSARRAGSGEPGMAPKPAAQPPVQGNMLVEPSQGAQNLVSPNILGVNGWFRGHRVQLD